MFFSAMEKLPKQNQFTRTVEELEVYVGAHFKRNVADIEKMIRTMKDTIFTPPKDLAEERTERD